MIYILCVSCHDVHDVVRAYRSRDRARVMADLGNRLEVASVTRHFINMARAAKSTEEREHWAHEMLQVRADGVRYWAYYVRKAGLIR